MDPVTFGKKIKEFYPQYADIDDAQIGQKYIQKYGPAIQSVSGGQIDIKDVPEAQRVAVGFGLNASGFQATSKEQAVAQNQGSEDFDSISKALDDVLETKKSVNGLEKIPFTGAIKKRISKDYANFDAKRKLVGQQIARLYEKGVLSDKDRAFYLGLMPDETYSQETADSAVKGIKSGLKTRLIRGKSAPPSERPDIETLMQQYLSQ